jgi:hypothetical protein
MRSARSRARALPVRRVATRADYLEAQLDRALAAVRERDESLSQRDAEIQRLRIDRLHLVRSVMTLSADLARAQGREADQDLIDRSFS